MSPVQKGDTEKRLQKITQIKNEEGQIVSGRECFERGFISPVTHKVNVEAVLAAKCTIISVNYKAYLKWKRKNR